VDNYRVAGLFQTRPWLPLCDYSPQVSYTIRIQDMVSHTFSSWVLLITTTHHMASNMNPSTLGGVSDKKVIATKGKMKIKFLL
jgi:hypothetical protein